MATPTIIQGRVTAAFRRYRRIRFENGDVDTMLLSPLEDRPMPVGLAIEARLGPCGWEYRVPTWGNTR